MAISFFKNTFASDKHNQDVDVSLPVAVTPKAVGPQLILATQPHQIELLRTWAEACLSSIVMYVKLTPRPDPFFDTLVKKIEQEKLSISVAQCTPTTWKEIFLRLGALAPYFPSNALTFRVVVAFHYSTPEEKGPNPYKEIEEVLRFLKQKLGSLFNCLVFSPSLFEADPSFAIHLEGNEILTERSRNFGTVRNFSLGNTLIWFNNVGEEKKFPGTKCLYVATMDQLLKYLPTDASFFLCLNYQVRIIITVTKDTVGSLNDLIGEIRKVAITTPILLHVDNTEVPPEVYHSFSRIWATNSPQMFQEYSSMQDLKWAPDLRLGNLDHPLWRGTLSITAVACRGLVPPNSNNTTCDTFAEFIVPKTDGAPFVQSAPTIKGSNVPRWEGLKWETKALAREVAYIRIRDHKSKECIGEAKLVFKDLLQEMSPRGPFPNCLVKTFQLQKETSGVKTKKNAPPTLRVSGTLTITCTVNTPPAEVQSLRYPAQYSEILRNSEIVNHLLPFPTTANRFSAICGTDQERIQTGLNHARSARIIVHADVMELYAGFLTFKLKYGTAIEKLIYLGMTPQGLCRRLVQKRPPVFFGGDNSTVMRNGQKLPRSDSWLLVGSGSEGELKMTDYLTFDEIPLAALLGVYSASFFINNGSRNNNGVADKSGSFAPTGYLVGLVGPRFELLDYMESQWILTSQIRSTPSNGYGLEADPNCLKTQFLNLWAKFYQQPKKDDLSLSEDQKISYFPAFDEIFLKQDEEPDSQDSGPQFPPVLPDYTRIFPDLYISQSAYKRRLRISVETFLLLANDLSQKSQQQVYCHVIGLGLGAWQIKRNEQNLWSLDVFDAVLSEFHFSGISDVNFSWFHDNVDRCGEIKNGQFLKGINSHIKVHFSKRNTGDPMDSQSKDKLLVAMYAWDGNAFPGNEYWTGQLNLSSDPATACATAIAEIQNPYINTAVLTNNIQILSPTTQAVAENKESQMGLGSSI